MKAKRLTFPKKATGDLLHATEIEEVRAVVADHADLLDTVAQQATTASQMLTLDDAQAILRSAPLTPDLVPGWLYLTGGAWDKGAAGQVVAVVAIGPRAFATYGTLVSGTSAKAVQVDVAAGTTGDLGAPDLSTIMAVLDQHTLQLKTLGVQAAPVMVYLEGGDVAGFTTLDEALADARPKTFMRFNVATVRVTKSNDPLNPCWASFVDGVGATIEVGAGVVLSIPGGNRGSLQFKNFFIYQAQGTRGGRVELLVTGNNNTPPGQLPVLDGECSVPLKLNGGAVALTGVYGAVQGSGDLHTFGLCDLGSTVAGINVVPQFVTGGGSYTDAEAQAAALASLMSGNALHQGVQVQDVNGVPKLIVAGLFTEVVRMRMPAAGSGNLAEGLDFREVNTAGLYKLTNATNVARLTILKENGPSTRFDDVLANFPTTGVGIEDNSYFTYRLLPIDSTQPVSLELTMTR
jgi:hypothetical protein